MTKPIRWGVLGASKFARQQMAPAIHAADNAVLAALATSSPEKAAPFAAMAPDIRVLDYDALLADPNIDAIYIPLPNHMHVDWTIRALEAGKAVLCEKPIAMQADEFDRLIEVRDGTGLLAAEAYMIVHHPQWQFAREVYRSGRLGTLKHVRAEFGYDNSNDTDNIRNKPETGGGSLPDIGVYTFGSTRFVTDQEPGEVRAQITWENDVDVLSLVQADFDGFTMSSMTSMRIQAHQEMCFIGTEGVMRLTCPFNPLIFPALPQVRIDDADGTFFNSFPGVNHYVLQVEAFGRAMRGEEDYPCPLEFSRGTQVMIDKAIAAAKGPGT